MPNTNSCSTLPRPQVIVKSQVNTQLPLFPVTMIHHSNSYPSYIRGNIKVIKERTGYYGVSSSYRVIPKSLFLKRYDRIRDSLKYVLQISPAQREVILRLLRYWAYYGNVYVKEALVTEEPGCSKATYWRTIRLLEERGLIKVIRRYLTPYRRQISNLYRFDKLLILIARYLAEHGVPFFEKWLKPYIMLPWPAFWSQQGLLLAQRSPPVYTLPPNV